MSMTAAHTIQMKCGNYLLVDHFIKQVVETNSIKYANSTIIAKMCVEEYSSITVKILEYFFCCKFEHQSKKPIQVDGIYNLDVSFLENMSGIQCTFGHIWSVVFSIRQFVRIFSGSEQVMTTFQEQENRPVLLVTVDEETAYTIRWNSGKICLEPSVCGGGDTQVFTITLNIRCSLLEAKDISLTVRGFLQRAAILHPDVSISLDHSPVNCTSPSQPEYTLRSCSKLVDKLRFSLRSAGVSPELVAVHESSVRSLQLHRTGSQPRLINADLTIVSCKFSCSSWPGHVHVCVLGTSGCPLPAGRAADWCGLVPLTSPHLCPGRAACAAPSPLPVVDVCYRENVRSDSSLGLLLVFTVYPHNESYWASHQQLAGQLSHLVAANRTAITQALQQEVHRVLGNTLHKVAADDKQCCHTVATAVSSVLRFSTHSEFRDQCFALMGVNNVHDAAEELEKCLLECIDPAMALSQNTSSGDSQATDIMCGSQSLSQGTHTSQQTSSGGPSREEEDTTEYENMWIQRKV